MSTEDVKNSIDNAEEVKPDGAPVAAAKRGSAATELIALARADTEFFHDGDDCYARVSIDRHFEVYQLKSRAFRRWLTQRYFQQHQKGAGSEAVKTAITTLEGFASFTGRAQKTYVRVAGFEERLYLDLCGPDWRVVEISATGWRVIESSECCLCLSPSAAAPWRP